MKYIDFHVHAFSGKIAGRTIEKIAGICGISPATDGTLEGTLQAMEQWGVDGMALLSIATKPSQHEVVNNWAASCRSDRVFPFGSVHPDGEALKELERIKALGLYGIKLHPDYQNFFVDEERLLPIYRRCGELGLPVILHAGMDPVSRDCVHCTPERAARVLAAVPETTFVLAHLGGMQMWNDVETLLAGRFENLFLDTALTGTYTEAGQMLRIIRRHGAERVLLASDCPWERTPDTVAKIKSLGLTTAEEKLIFAENAQRLLGIAEQTE
jgi:hypothetical protein